MNNYSGVVQRADGEFVQLLMHINTVNREGFHVFMWRSSIVMSSEKDFGFREGGRSFTWKKIWNMTERFSHASYSNTYLVNITEVSWWHIYHVDTSADVMYTVKQAVDRPVKKEQLNGGVKDLSNRKIKQHFLVVSSINSDLLESQS